MLAIWKGGAKNYQKMPTNRSKKLPAGEGVKNMEEFPTSFFDGPIRVLK